jgi:hypothetical protein
MKIIKIKTCLDCQSLLRFQQYLEKAIYSCKRKRVELALEYPAMFTKSRHKEIENPREIPVWCPLKEIKGVPK